MSLGMQGTPSTVTDVPDAVRTMEEDGVTRDMADALAGDGGVRPLYSALLLCSPEEIDTEEEGDDEKAAAEEEHDDDEEEELEEEEEDDGVGEVACA